MEMAQAMELEAEPALVQELEPATDLAREAADHPPQGRDRLDPERVRPQPVELEGQGREREQVLEPARAVLPDQILFPA